MANNDVNGKAWFQIQPQFSSHQEWEELAEKENLMFEALELSMPPALDESGRFQTCLEWYRELRRTTSVHGAFIDVNPASGDRRLRDLSRLRMLKSCTLAVWLGAGNVVFHSSCCTFLRGAYLDHWAAECADFFEELAAKYPLRIFIENSQDVDTTPLMELMRRTSTPGIGVCLDLGHANYSGTPLEQWFYDLGDRIGYLHLSDNRGRFDDHLPLGTGTVDWKEADRLWRAAGKEMPMTLETGSPEGIKASLRFLRENSYFGCAEEKSET